MLPDEIRGFIEVAVTAVSVLGGAMAGHSGYAAAQAMSEGQSPAVLSQSVNEGIAKGFSWGSPTAVIALIILLWT